MTTEFRTRYHEDETVEHPVDIDYRDRRGIDNELKETDIGFADIIKKIQYISGGGYTEKLEWEGETHEKFTDSHMARFTASIKEEVEHATETLSYGQSDYYEQDTKALLNGKALREVLERSLDYPLERPMYGVEKTARRVESAGTGRLEEFVERGGDITKVPNLLKDMNHDIVNYNQTGEIPSWFDHKYVDPDTQGLTDPVNHNLFYDEDWQDALLCSKNTWTQAAENYAQVCQEATRHVTMTEPGLTEDPSYRAMTDAMEQLVILEHHQTLAGPLDYREENLERLADLGNELRMLRWQTTSAAERNGLTPERWDQAREGWLEQTENDLNTQLIQDPDWQERFKEAQDMWIQSAENYTSLARDATTDAQNFRSGSSLNPIYNAQLEALREAAILEQHQALINRGNHRTEEMERLEKLQKAITKMGWDTIDSERQEDLELEHIKDRRND